VWFFGSLFFGCYFTEKLTKKEITLNSLIFLNLFVIQVVSVILFLHFSKNFLCKHHLYNV